MALISMTLGKKVDLWLPGKGSMRARLGNCVWWHPPEAEDAYNFETCLGYIASSRPPLAIQQETLSKTKTGFEFTSCGWWANLVNTLNQLLIWGLVGQGYASKLG